MIFLLYGADQYRARKKLKEIQEKFLNTVDSSGINLTILEDKNLNWEKIHGVLSTVPFLVSKRMVVIKNLLNRSGSEKIQKDLMEYIQQDKIGDDLILVFLEHIKSDPKKKWKQKTTVSGLFRFLQQGKFVQKFDIMPPLKVEEWIKQEIESQRSKIALPAVRLLASEVGPDLEKMNNEIEKLVSYKLDEEITEKDVRLLVKGKFDDNIFNLIDAIGTRNQRLAMKLIGEQMSDGLNASMLLAMIIRQYRILLQIKESVDNNAGAYLANAQLAKRIGVHPFVVQKAYNQVKFYSLNQLKKIYQQLLEIDLDLKTSRVKNPELLFDLLVADK